MSALRERLPPTRDILDVFGGVVFVVYSWAVRGFLYQVPSLRLYHTLGEIFGVFSYLMAFALVESLILIGVLVLGGIILPAKWLREGFGYKGFITFVVAGIAMIQLDQYLFSLGQAMPALKVIYLGTGLSILLLVGLIRMFQRIPRLQKYLFSLQERLQIFVYFYVPLGVLGIAVVVLRNLR